MYKNKLMEAFVSKLGVSNAKELEVLLEGDEFDESAVLERLGRNVDKEKKSKTAGRPRKYPYVERDVLKATIKHVRYAQLVKLAKSLVGKVSKMIIKEITAEMNSRNPMHEPTKTVIERTTRPKKADLIDETAVPSEVKNIAQTVEKAQKKATVKKVNRKKKSVKSGCGKPKNVGKSSQKSRSKTARKINKGKTPKSIVGKPKSSKTEALTMKTVKYSNKKVKTMRNTNEKVKRTILKDKSKMFPQITENPIIFVGSSDRQEFLNSVISMAKTGRGKALDLLGRTTDRTKIVKDDGKSTFQRIYDLGRAKWIISRLGLHRLLILEEYLQNRGKVFIHPTILKMVDGYLDFSGRNDDLINSAEDFNGNTEADENVAELLATRKDGQVIRSPNFLNGKDLLDEKIDHDAKKANVLRELLKTDPITALKAFGLSEKYTVEKYHEKRSRFHVFVESKLRSVLKSTTVDECEVLEDYCHSEVKPRYYLPFSFLKFVETRRKQHQSKGVRVFGDSDSRKLLSKKDKKRLDMDEISSDIDGMKSFMRKINSNWKKNRNGLLKYLGWNGNHEVIVETHSKTFEYPNDDDIFDQLPSNVEFQFDNAEFKKLVEVDGIPTVEITDGIKVLWETSYNKPIFENNDVLNALVKKVKVRHKKVKELYKKGELDKLKAFGTEIIHDKTLKADIVKESDLFPSVCRFYFTKLKVLSNFMMENDDCFGKRQLSEISLLISKINGLTVNTDAKKVQAFLNNEGEMETIEVPGIDFHESTAYNERKLLSDLRYELAGCRADRVVQAKEDKRNKERKGAISSLKSLIFQKYKELYKLQVISEPVVSIAQIDMIHERSPLVSEKKHYENVFKMVRDMYEANKDNVIVKSVKYPKYKQGKGESMAHFIERKADRIKTKWVELGAYKRPNKKSVRRTSVHGKEILPNPFSNEISSPKHTAELVGNNRCEKLVVEKPKKANIKATRPKKGKITTYNIRLSELKRIEVKSVKSGILLAHLFKRPINRGSWSKVKKVVIRKDDISNFLRANGINCEMYSQKLNSMIDGDYLRTHKSDAEIIEAKRRREIEQNL